MAKSAWLQLWLPSSNKGLLARFRVWLECRCIHRPPRNRVAGVSVCGQDVDDGRIIAGGVVGTLAGIKGKGDVGASAITRGQSKWVPVGVGVADRVGAGVMVWWNSVGLTVTAGLGMIVAVAVFRLTLIGTDPGVGEAVT